MVNWYSENEIDLLNLYSVWKKYCIHTYNDFIELAHKYSCNNLSYPKPINYSNECFYGNKILLCKPKLSLCILEDIESVESDDIENERIENTGPSIDMIEINTLNDDIVTYIDEKSNCVDLMLEIRYYVDNHPSTLFRYLNIVELENLLT